MNINMHMCKKKKVPRLFLRFECKIGTLTIRRSGMLRSYKIGSRPFDTFARWVFCVWLDRVASSRNSIKTIDFS